MNLIAGGSPNAEVDILVALWDEVFGALSANRPSYAVLVDLFSV